MAVPKRKEDRAEYEIFHPDFLKGNVKNAVLG
jgi:hypothetical protein